MTSVMRQEAVGNLSHNSNGFCMSMQKAERVHLILLLWQSTEIAPVTLKNAVRSPQSKNRPDMAVSWYVRFRIPILNAGILPMVLPAKKQFVRLPLPTVLPI